MQFYINFCRAICAFECSKDSDILLINIKIEHVLSLFNLNRYVVLFFIVGIRFIKKYKQGGGGESKFMTISIPGEEEGLCFKPFIYSHVQKVFGHKMASTNAHE